MAEWIEASLGPETPWHLTRFQPAYKLADLTPTPSATLCEASRIARETGLRHVYVGNAPECESADTHCYRCGELLVRRKAFSVLEWRLIDGHCPRCGHTLVGFGLEASPLTAETPRG
jgi:pyruvate formate lyase activating enzyme